MPQVSAPSPKPVFLYYFEEVDDPRQIAKILYPFDEILLLVLCAVISGADNWTSIALYGQKKLDLLRRFLPFVDGTPCHDQLGILFSRLDMEQFQQCFVNWVAAFHKTTNSTTGVIAVDGKTLRRSFDTASGEHAEYFTAGVGGNFRVEKRVGDKLLHGIFPGGPEQSGDQSLPLHFIELRLTHPTGGDSEQFLRPGRAMADRFHHSEL